MKIRSASFDDDEFPEEFVVSLGVDELALIYALSGRLAPVDVSTASGDIRWGEALFVLAEGAGNILCRFFDSPKELTSFTVEQVIEAKKARLSED